jgi:hypothetical protein
MLAKYVASRLIDVLRQQLLARTMANGGKFKAVRIWALTVIN